MATIKSYTDLEQSKKLAEILPLESADMYYPWYIEEDGDTIESGHRISTPNIGDFITHKVNKMVLPCWSLASLLNYLKSKNKFPKIEELSDGCFRLTTYIWDGKDCIQVSIGDSIVYACVAMIERLHELKLL